jgi:hypothetical protein
MKPSDSPAQSERNLRGLEVREQNETANGAIRIGRTTNRVRYVMLSHAKGTVLLAGAVAAVLVTAAPAGTAEPFRIRTVTMNGTQGPAYYSRLSGGYRFLATADAGKGLVASVDNDTP